MKKPDLYKCPGPEDALAPPLIIARASSKRGAHWRNQKQRKHNGAEATILYWAPLSSLPPPKSSLVSKGVQLMKLTTELGPSDQTIPCKRGIRSSCDRIAAEKRRCKWIVLKTRPHLNKENAYGGGRRDEEGSPTSLPVPASLYPGLCLLGCQRASARDGRRPFHGSAVPRVLGLPLENACLEFFFKATSNSSATVGKNRHKRN